MFLGIKVSGSALYNASSVFFFVKQCFSLHLDCSSSRLSQRYLLLLRSLDFILMFCFEGIGADSTRPTGLIWTLELARMLEVRHTLVV